MKLRYYSMIRNGFYDSVDVVMVSLEGGIGVYCENIPISLSLPLPQALEFHNIRAKQRAVSNRKCKTLLKVLLPFCHCVHLSYHKG